MHTGLIAECPDVSCLAGVIAHEAGHIKGGHIIRKTEDFEDANLSTIAGYVLGLGSVLAGAPPEAGIALSSAGQNVAIRQALSSSREYENSADMAALDIMKKVDITPRGLIAILDKLNRRQTIAGDIHDKYMLTHPISQERITSIESHIREHPEIDKPLPANLEKRFQMIKAKIYGFLYEPKITRDIYSNLNELPAIYANTISYHQEAKFDRSNQLLKRLLTEDPKNPFFNELEAQFLFERGDIKKSADKYRQVLSSLGNSNLVRLKLADALINLNNEGSIREAIGQLKAILATDPTNVNAINKLGIAYGKIGNLEESYIYLSESAIISKKLENAKFYLAKAEQLVDKSSSNYNKLLSLKKEARKIVENN